MYLMPFVLIIEGFLAGLLICNAVPHLSTGLRGEAFPTPFATPRGAGRSSPLVNALWGWFNLFLGFLLLPRIVLFSPVMPLFNTVWLAFALGFLVAAVYLATHFGRVRRSAP